MGDTALNKCLGVAEQIIGALNDPSVYERYVKIKAGIFSTPELWGSEEYRRLLSENRTLNLRLEEIKGKFDQEVTVEEWAANQLRIMQNEFLPESAANPFRTFDEASTSILCMIENKVAGHRFLRKKLETENQYLRDLIHDMKTDSLEHIEASRKRRIDREGHWAQAEEIVHQRIATLKRTAESVRRKLIEVIKQTTVLRATVEGLESSPKKDQKEDIREKRMDELGEQQQGLTSEWNRLRFEIKKTNNEIAELQKIRHFAVDPDDGMVNLKLGKKKLLAEILDLEDERKGLENRIKEMRCRSSSLLD
jgi:hypothetical protein